MGGTLLTDFNLFIGIKTHKLCHERIDDLKHFKNYAGFSLKWNYSECFSGLVR